MQLVTDIQIEIRPEDVLRSQMRKSTASAQLETEIASAIPLAMSLINPLIAYAFVEIEKVANEKVYVRTGSDSGFCELNVGPHTELFEPAKIGMVYVHSIGSDLEAKVKELNDSGNYLQGYILDCAGLVALSEVGKQAHRIAEQKAKEENWGVSASISPGSLEEWELAGQKNLCSLLDMEKAGITLSDSFVLVPYKSVSSFIGMGPGYKSKKVGSICHLCRLRDTCWRRQ